MAIQCTVGAVHADGELNCAKGPVPYCLNIETDKINSSFPREIHSIFRPQAVGLFDYAIMFG